MRNESIEELTAQLQELILENRNKEKTLIEKINRIKTDNTKEKATTIDNRLEVGDEVTYTTNGVHKRSQSGTITKFTKHRVVIKTPTEEHIYRARNNVFKKR